jgi:hypothetical protein
MNNQTPLLRFGFFPSLFIALVFTSLSGAAEAKGEGGPAQRKVATTIADPTSSANVNGLASAL